MTTPGNEKPFTVRITADEAGSRLDKCLAVALPDLSRSRLRPLIEAGQVSVADSAGGDKPITDPAYRGRPITDPAYRGRPITDPAYRVRAGQLFRVIVPEPEQALPAAQDILLSVVFEDEDVIIVDKAAGMVVHPAPGNPDSTLVNALLAHCGASLSGIGGVKRPGIVHRIDKDTSGLIIAAKNDLAHRGLAAQFAAHSLERAYQAVLWGVPSPAQGTIEGNIGRNPRNRKSMAVVSSGGKTALTRYRVLKTFGTAASLVECRLATGRTHQIRVHMASIGHPLVGDPLYGRTRGNASTPMLKALRAFPRQALHAYLIGFNHPRTGGTLRFQSDLPYDMNELIYFLDTC